MARRSGLPRLIRCRNGSAIAFVADTSQQKALMLVGPKRSGKGTIARILEAVIGPHNAGVADAREPRRRKFKG